MESKSKRVVEAVLDLSPRPTVDAVLDHFMTNVGGAAAFGKMLADEYTASGPGSMIRAKIVETILRRMEKSEDRNRRDDFAGLGDEDLKLMVAERERVMLSQVPTQQEKPDGSLAGVDGQVQGTGSG